MKSDNLEPAGEDLVSLRRATAPLDLYRMSMRGGTPRAPIAELLNMRVVEVESGRIVFSAVPERKFYNQMGGIHGGYYGILLDTAMGCAIHTKCGAGFAYATLEYKVTLIRPMSEATGTVRCEGRVLNVGERIGTAEGSITDVNGKLYAHGTTTCIVFPT